MVNFEILEKPFLVFCALYDGISMLNFLRISENSMAGNLNNSDFSNSTQYIFQLAKN